MRKFLMLGAVLGLCAVVLPTAAATAGGVRAGGAGSGQVGSGQVGSGWARLGGSPVGAPSGTPTLTADPSTGLLDGQSISVSGSGLAAKNDDLLAECVTGATSPVESCDVETVKTVKTGASGSFTTSYTAVRMIEVGGSSSTVDCATADACILVVIDGNLSILAGTPISFADVVVVPPTVTAVPDSGLLDGQKITVSGTNWSPGALIALGECPVNGSVCGFITSGKRGITVGSAGTFSGSFTVSRFIEGEDGVLDCAQPSTCLLEAVNAGDPDQTATTPITFADVVVVPPVLTATPSADLVDGQNITVTGTGFAHHDIIELVECAAGVADDAECGGLDGEGNVVEAKTDSRGRLTATTFNVARVLTLGNATVDCAVAPGCVIGAVDEESPEQVPAAVTALTFNPDVPPLPPLNLELKIDPTGSLVAAPGGQTDAEINGTVSCDRTTAVPVFFELQVSQQGKQLNTARFDIGEMTCQRGGVKFSETVPTSRRHPAVAGIAGVLMGLSADSGSSSQDISVSTSVTLKAPKS
jgi:hypothetical protein